MTSRSDDFRGSGEEENVVYEGEEADGGTPLLGSSSGEFSKREIEGDFPTEPTHGTASLHSHTVNASPPCDVFQKSYDREETNELQPSSQQDNGTQFQDKNSPTHFAPQPSTVYVSEEDMDGMRASADPRSAYPEEEFDNSQRTQDGSQEQQDSTKNTIQEHAAGCTLYVRNLPPHIRSEHVKEHFAQFGDVIDCRIIMNPVTKDSRGFGFVSFATPEIADLAMEKSIDVRIEGKLLRVEKARRNKPHDPTPGEYKGPTGASIKYDNCGRLKPGRHYRRSVSRDRVGSYRGSMMRRGSGDYSSRHMKHYDSPGGRDYGYYGGYSQNRLRSPPYFSQRMSYQGGSPLHNSLRHEPYHHHHHHRSSHYDTSRDSGLGMNKHMRKPPYDMEHPVDGGGEDHVMRRQRSSSRASRHQDFYPSEQPHRHGQSHHSAHVSHHWERSSRTSYHTHSSKDHRAAPYPSHHRSLRNNDYCLGSTMDPPSHQNSSVNYGSRHSSRGRPYDEHDYYGGAPMSHNPASERYATGEGYARGGSSRALRSRGLSGEEHYSHRGPSSTYGTTTSGVSRSRRLSLSSPPHNTSRYGGRDSSGVLRNDKANEPSQAALYASNERIQRHLSSARSRSPLDVRGAPMSSTFVCHH